MQKQTISDQDMPVITEKHIEAIVEQKTNIPVGDLKEKNNHNFLALLMTLSHMLLDKMPLLIRLPKLSVVIVLDWRQTAQLVASSS
ncbi:MAG: hypothetical protein ACLUSV_04860 [Streptococcus sp.]